MNWNSLFKKLKKKPQTFLTRSQKTSLRRFINPVSWIIYLLESILFPIWSILLSKETKSNLTYISYGLSTFGVVLLSVLLNAELLFPKRRIKHKIIFKVVLFLTAVLYAAFKMILYDITVQEKEYQYVCVMELLILVLWPGCNLILEAWAILITFCLYGFLSNVVSRNPPSILIGEYVIVTTILVMNCYSSSTSSDINPKMIRKLTLIEQKRAWEDHLGGISDLILIVDATNEIIYSNKAYKKICQEESANVEDFSLIRRITRLKLADGNNEQFNSWIQEKHKISGTESIFKSFSTNKFTDFRTISSDGGPFGRKTPRKLSKHKTLPLAVDLERLIGMISTNIDEYSSIMQDRVLVIYGKLSKENSILCSFEIKITVSMEGENKVLFILITETTHRDRIFELEEINKFKNQLLGSISHEIRTPLSSNKNFLEVAEKSDQIPKEIKDGIIRPIVISSYLLTFLLDDILDLSMMELKTLRLKYTTEPIHKSLMEVNDIFKIQSKQKKCPILLDVHEKVPTEFRTDFQRLKRILINILQISVSDTSQGTIKIKVRAGNDCADFFVIRTGTTYSLEEVEQITKILKGRMTKTTNDGVSDKYLRLHIATKLTQSLSPGNKGLTFQSDPDETMFCFSIEKIAADENQRDFNLSELEIYDEANRGMTKMPSQAGTLRQLTRRTTRNEVNRGRTIPLSPREDIEEDRNPQANILPSEELGLQRGEVIDMENIGLDQLLSHRHNQPCQAEATMIQPVIKYREHMENDNQYERNYLYQECECHMALIVDDDIFSVRSLKMLLGVYGLPCDEAYNGKSAIDKIYGKNRCCKKCKLYSIIFLDCNMPILDGYRTADLLKKNMRESGEIESTENTKEAERLPYIPIVACTAYIATKQANEIPGIDEFMEKPIDTKLLLEILKKYNIRHKQDNNG